MTREEAAEMYALGVPVEIIADGLGKTVSAVRAMFRRIPRPAVSRLALARQRRLKRIRANVAASPSVSMFVWRREHGEAA